MGRAEFFYARTVKMSPPALPEGSFFLSRYTQLSSISCFLARVMSSTSTSLGSLPS